MYELHVWSRAGFAMSPRHKGENRFGRGPFPKSNSRGGFRVEWGLGDLPHWGETIQRQTTRGQTRKTVLENAITVGCPPRFVTVALVDFKAPLP